MPARERNDPFGIENLLGFTPAKVTLSSNPGTEQEEGYEVLLNPSQLRETINVEWSKLPVVGLDHEIPHYARTKSLEIPMTFYFSQYENSRGTDAIMPGLARGAAVVGLSNLPPSKFNGSSMDFANFMRSLCFPSYVDLRPPPVRFTWPNILDMVGVVTSLTLDYKKFDTKLAPLIYQADVTFLETRIQRRWSEVVRRLGLIPDPGLI